VAIGTIDLTEKTRALGRRRSIWENNIKIDLMDIEQRDLDWICFAQYWDKCQARAR
jgi:hypothetical protein